MRVVLISAAVCAAVALPVHAGGLFSFEEVGGDVVGTFSGTLDLAPSDSFGVVTSPVGLSPEDASIVTGTVGAIDVPLDVETPLPFGYAYELVGLEAFGTGGFAAGTVAPGTTPFGLFGSAARDETSGVLTIDPGFLLDPTFTGSMTIAGASFASLGITPGESLITILPPPAPIQIESVFAASARSTADATITLRFVAPTEVPLPAGAALLLGALGFGAVVARRRRGAARA